MAKLRGSPGGQQLRKSHALRQNGDARENAKGSEEIRAHAVPAASSAEALRRSMVSMIDRAPADPKTADEAHPMFWAPFIVVGEGGLGR